MKQLYLISAATLIAAIAQPASAQQAPPDGLTLSGSVRMRYEALDGQARAGFGAEDELFSIRTIILAEYRENGFRAGIELYDSRAYGSQPGSAIGTAEVNTLEPVQAYIGYEVREPFGRGTALAVQAGRFTLNLGSRRLVAADDYRNTTNGYSGLRGDIRASNGTAATLFYTLPQVRLPDDRPSILDNKVRLDRESFDLQLWGGLVSRPRVVAGALVEIGYIGLTERDAPGRPTRNRHLHNVSARLIRDPAPGKADFEVEGIYQFGSVRSSLAADAPELDVSAWFLHADAGYTFPGPLKARLSVEYDHASGDGSGRSYGRFDTLFGMRRADLAPAGIYAQIGRANISTPGVRLEMAPTPRLDGFVAYRAMWLAERTDAFSTTGVRDPSGRSGSFAGHQIEGRVRWWLIPNLLRAEINGAWLGKGRFLEDAPNAPRTGNTRYVSIAVTAGF
ncbi:alginate export family protein [Alteraurantiacibacter palmitatis]|uniref:Alginate export family protein n=1 Tax=Alteraurantiacibacter palmitatis TaxID=2054628 RepID=A0ABV7EA22_9SPHN